MHSQWGFNALNVDAMVIKFVPILHCLCGALTIIIDPSDHFHARYQLLEFIVASCVVPEEAQARSELVHRFKLQEVDSVRQTKQFSNAPCLATPVDT